MAFPVKVCMTTVAAAAAAADNAFRSNLATRDIGQPPRISAFLAAYSALSWARCWP